MNKPACNVVLKEPVMSNEIKKNESKLARTIKIQGDYFLIKKGSIR